MGITLEQNTAKSVVRLEGSIDISLAAELKALFAKALSAGKDVSVSLDQVSYLDVTAVQLLWAAGQQARRSGIGFSLSGHLSDPLFTLLANAGIPSFPDSAHPAAAIVQ